MASETGLPNYQFSEQLQCLDSAEVRVQSMPRMDEVFTLDEVAAALRMTRRGVLKIAKRHGLCMVHGREVTFTESDVEGIKQAMRPAAKQPLPAVAVRSQVEGRVGKVKSASPKLRNLFLQRSTKPWAKKLLKEEFGE
ncbi:helix-turn-helix domain-containing protein [Mesorhizobium hawassense]|uniref:helix-turn-helix domain-containing protein n=1 Tax=Mesorhizobium hawassense TaxID=1209954 RepID=UPI0011BF8A9E|nr:helix-turn-helix domain-containing protein [Mesorhizobium hawassense]